MEHYKILKLGFPFEVLNRDLRLIFGCNLIGSFGDGLYAYLLPVYLTDTLKASSVEVGILYAVVGLVSALTLLSAGMLADRYDRRKIMVAGWLAWVPVPLVFSLAGNWLQTLPGMILWGVWLGGPTSTAYIVTAADKNKLTLTFTAISSAWSFGYIFSPAVGGYLAGTIGMRVVFYAASILYASAALTLFFISSQHAVVSTQHSVEERQSFLKLLRTRKLLTLSVFFASIMFTITMFRPFVPKFLQDMYHYGTFEIGLLGSVSFFGSAVLGVLLGKLGDRWRKAYAVAASMALCSLSLTLLLLFGYFDVLMITFFLAGGSYITWSLMSAIIGPLAPESIRARWVSVPQTVTIFCSFIAPCIGGVLYNASPYCPFITAIVITLFLALLATTNFFEKIETEL
jgi:DHA1 family multidrug resistance protein-like MFS transporter